MPGTGAAARCDGALSAGEHDLTLNVGRRDSGEVVFSGGARISIIDPSKGMELGLPVPPVTFPREGKYVVGLILDGRELHDRILDVVMVSHKES